MQTDKTQDQSTDADAAGALTCSDSLAAVLFPADPPAPTNVRVLRRFGIEDQKKIRRLEKSMLFGGRQADPARGPQKL